jgi:hypothetical protein
MTYFLTPVHQTLDPDTDEVVSIEWGMLDGDDEIVSALAACPIGLSTLGSNDTQFGVSVPANPQGMTDGVLGPWTAPTGWTPSTLAEIQSIFGGA